MSRVLVVGLNPAWQKTLNFTSLQKGQVNRAESLHFCASGKGMNTAKVLSCFKHQVSLLQIVGGDNGRRVVQACSQYGINSIHLEVPGETRVCNTLICRETMKETEIIEPFAPGIPAAEISSKLISLINNSATYDAVVIAGQAPDGCENDIYGKLLNAINADLTVLDAYKNISEALLKRVNVVKINKMEVEVLQKLYPELLHTNGHPEQKLFLITNGPSSARFNQLTGDDWEQADIPVPEIENVQNPIGAGDVVTGAFVHFSLCGLSAKDAFQKAIAAGTASCLSPVPAEFEMCDMENLIKGKEPG
ncbi:MAG: hypothetical protein HQK83_07290 [Fibrobacteria bacterium]|nr:hypothetical protein [Fibrobacteria bacterium]